MPVSKHFGGHGTEVMSSMKKTYGAKKAKQVFYATENKKKNQHEGIMSGLHKAMKSK